MNIARILLQQLTEIGLNHGIRRGTGDVHGDSVGSCRIDCLTHGAAPQSTHSTQRLAGHAGAGVELGHHLKIKGSLRGNSARAGGRAEHRNGSVEVINARALRR